MRVCISVLVCLLVAYHPCNSFFFDVMYGRKFFGRDSSQFKNENTDGHQNIHAFKQKLDHFDPTNNITWTQFYSENTEFYKNGTSSPVFLWVGEKSYCVYEQQLFNAWIGYGKKYGALCLVLAQRYYGIILPTKNASLENLKYLNIEQSLADVAYFIEGMNKKYGLTNENKWITFGALDGGTLAAWARYKYPHLVHGAVTSSSPVLAKTNFHEYYDKVKSSLDTSGKNCSNIITEANHQMQQLIKTEAGRLKITETFQLCRKLDIKNKTDEENFFAQWTYLVPFLVENNNFYKPTFFHNKTGIDFICNTLNDPSLGKPLDRFAELILQFSFGPCVEILSYSELVEYFRKVSRPLGVVSRDRQILYQQCTQFGFFKTSEKENSLYGPTVSLQFFANLCTDVFGPSFNLQKIESGVNRTNTIYGGLKINATRVVYVDGSLDPWHPLTITHSNNPEAPAIIIKGASLYEDAYVSSEDLPQVKEARSKISALIGDWLKEK